jgi:adenylosuccinate synthase
VSVVTDKVYIITDLGPGDGGKGGVIHKITSMRRVHTIIKRGGAQGSHGVATSNGQRFAFSQWGCGTLSSIPTHLSEQMIISPEGLLNEASYLRYVCGIHDAFSLLTVDERALCATPFHGIASRLIELGRGAHPRGTVGTGVGEAYRRYRQEPELAILAKDLKRPGLRDRLADIRAHVRSTLQSLGDSGFLADDIAERDLELPLLYDDGFLDHVASRFAEVAAKVTVVSEGYLSEHILTKAGSALIETSHGVLTDRLVGFHPHTSAIRTLPSFSHQLLKNAGYDKQVVDIGVSRAYAVRHGAGPLPTADSAMTERLLPGSSKEGNRYQGTIRVGPLDFVLLRYAIEACGGTASFDGLAVTCFDQVHSDGVWGLCHRYGGATDLNFFTESGEVRVDLGQDGEHLKHQRALGRHLLSCLPEIVHQPIESVMSNDDLFAVCATTVHESTGVPVRMVSFGPTEQDKLCK